MVRIGEEESGGGGGGCGVVFFFNDTATTEIYTLSLHDALPIYIDLACIVGHIHGRLPCGITSTYNVNVFILTGYRLSFCSSVIHACSRKVIYSFCG